MQGLITLKLTSSKPFASVSAWLFSLWLNNEVTCSGLPLELILPFETVSEVDKEASGLVDTGEMSSNKLASACGQSLSCIQIWEYCFLLEELDLILLQRVQKRNPHSNEKFFQGL